MTVEPVKISTAKKPTKKVTIAKVGNKNIQIPDALPARTILDYFEEANKPRTNGFMVDTKFLKNILGDDQWETLSEAEGFEITDVTKIVANVLTVVLEGN